MKPIFLVLLIASLCHIISQAPTSSRAEGMQADERVVQAKALEGLLPEAYNSALATLPHKDRSRISLTVATKRVDSSTAVLAVSINTNDPRLLTDIPAVECSFQPVELSNGTVAQTIGTPMKVSVGSPLGSSPTGNTTIRTISSVVTAQEAANALSIRTTLKGKFGDMSFRYVISTKDEVNLGTVTISNYPFALTNQASRTRTQSKPSLLRSSFPAADGGGDCVEATVTCGTCSRSANCMVGPGHGEITFICDCSSSPCSCGIICDGGCPPFIN